MIATILVLLILATAAYCVHLSRELVRTQALLRQEQAAADEANLIYAEMAIRVEQLEAFEAVLNQDSKPNAVQEQRRSRNHLRGITGEIALPHPSHKRRPR